MSSNLKLLSTDFDGTLHSDYELPAVQLYRSVSVSCKQLALCGALTLAVTSTD